MKCRLRESNPDTVTHPSTNWAKHRLISLIEINDATTKPRHRQWYTLPYNSAIRTRLAASSLVITKLLNNLIMSTTSQQKSDLFKYAGTVDAITDTVDQFQKAHAERPQHSVFHQRRVMKIKVDEDRLCQRVALQPCCLT